MPQDTISHQGTITAITDEIISVSIVSMSACSSCHAKGYCSVADMKEKIVEVANTGKDEHKLGDFVSVSMKQSLGLKAVGFGYFIPFLLLVLTLILALSYVENQGVAGLLALAVLAPYYLVLYLFRAKLKSKFNFIINTQ